MASEKNKYVSVFQKFIDKTTNYISNINKNTEFIDTNVTKLDSFLEILDLGYMKVFLPIKNLFLESKKKWAKYLEDNDIRDLTQDDIYNLAFDYSAFNDLRYWDILKLEEFQKDEILFALVRNFHYYWTDLDNFDFILNHLKTYLSRIKSERKLIINWKKNPDIILGSKNVSLESRLFSLINHNITKISAIYSNKLYDIKEYDLLANIIKFNYLLMIFEKEDFFNRFEEYFKLFVEFFETSVTPNFRLYDYRKTSKSLDEKRNQLLAKLIIKINLYKQNDSYKNILVRFVLDHPLYGDPRERAWVNYNDEKSSAIFRTWLNEKDVRFFFENLIDNIHDTHDRKGFWIQNADKIEASIFVLGNNVEVNRKNEKEIARFKNKSSKNVFTIGSSTNLVKSNIFILKIKNLVFVEFSEYGHACFIYKYDVYCEHIKPYLQTQNSRMKLRLTSFKLQKDFYVDKISHDDWGNWKAKVSRYFD